MTAPIVEVEGVQATELIDVSYGNGTGGTIGNAEITVGNSSANRDLFESGADVVIKEDGDVVWSGEVIGKPSNTERANLTLTVDAETKAGQAEYGKVNRPFIEMSRGDMVRQAVDFEVEPYTRTRRITFADTTTSWSSSGVDIFEKTDDSRGINKFGQDTLFVGMTEDTTGTPSVTFHDVPSTAAPGRRILQFETRFLLNNRGDVFDVTVTLTDADGVEYAWEVPVGGFAEWEIYELSVEDASITTGGDPLTLTYDFAIDGVLPEDRAAAIDMARTTPFRLEGRQIGLDHDVDDTDDQITRRVDDSILNLADGLAVEAGATTYVTTDDVLRFDDDPESAPYAITDDGDTNVVAVDVDRDFDVKNQVTVQGKGDLQATFEDTSSVEFYNVEAPRPEPITDKSLRTRDQLATRARGFLRENAWEDSAITFTLAGAKWREVRAGQIIPVDWSKEDVAGDFMVDSTGRTDEGYTTIGLSGNTEV